MGPRGGVLGVSRALGGVGATGAGLVVGAGVASEETPSGERFCPAGVGIVATVVGGIAVVSGLLTVVWVAGVTFVPITRSYASFSFGSRVGICFGSI